MQRAFVFRRNSISERVQTAVVLQGVQDLTELNIDIDIMRCSRYGNVEGVEQRSSMIAGAKSGNCCKLDRSRSRTFLYNI